MFCFEKLLVWQKAVDFAKEIYGVTSAFPKDEIFGITSQLRRASVSVSLNIAEGAGRTSKKEFKHFLSIAYGSVCETATLLKICRELSYINDEQYRGFYNSTEEIGRMISGLSASKNSKP
ncbi:MAG: four helix bundle protein [Elusimicrobia bacterium]|nr:four helix bundle protein [Elusimicrobiota bacterium]